MTSIVLELQRDALDQSVQITSLLRKALVVARKLRQSDFQEWIQYELNGYSGDVEIPNYRDLQGQVKGWNPERGWIPLIVNDVNFEKKISKRYCGDSISEIENLLGKRDRGLTFSMPLQPELQQLLREAVNFDTEFSLFVQENSLSRIVDAVRNTVLNWTIKLKEDGILGEGLTFSSSEKAAAAQAQYNVNTFFGDVVGSQIQQATKHSVQTITEKTLDFKALENIVHTLREQLDSFGLDQESKTEVASDLSTIESQLGSPRPKTTIIRESLKSIRSVLEAAGGNVVAQVLIKLGSLLN